MVKRQRTESLATPSESSQDSITPAGNRAAGPATPLTTAEEHHVSKIQHVDTASSPTGVSGVVMRCSLPPHPPQDFVTYDEYEVHYRKHHTNRCHECAKNFPSDHYLNLHIAENHDPLNEAKRDRGEKTYACFVSGCDKVCLTPQRRRWHALAKHEFPKNYDFFIVNDGIDRRNSMLRPNLGQRPRSSLRTKHDGPSSIDNAMETVAEDTTVAQQASAPPRVALSPASSQPRDVDVEDVTASLSALKFVPHSVRFGRGRGRGGFARG